MKKVIFTLVFSFILMSCGTTSFVNRAKKLELGMTKREVISVMGNDYRVVSAVQTPEGGMEVLRYVASIDAREYILYILDGKLVEWHEESSDTRPQNSHHNQGRHNHK